MAMSRSDSPKQIKPGLKGAKPAAPSPFGVGPKPPSGKSRFGYTPGPKPPKVPKGRK